MFVVGIGISGCRTRADQASKRIQYRQSRLQLGTLVNLNVCATEEDAPRLGRAFNRIWSRFDEIYALMSLHKSGSDILRLNSTYPQPVRIDPTTYRLIESAVLLGRLTRGAFDITIRPLALTWSHGQSQQSIPSHQVIFDRIRYVGDEYLRLIPPDQVQRLSDKVQVDLGGIAKGYAIDEAARLFREEGFSDFFIDAGGDVYCGGVNCRGQPWQIGIRHPRQPKKIIDVVFLQDMAATTSGDYARFYIIEGQKWSHIINPITGYPQKGVASATVMAPDAMTADALSTAFCVLPPRTSIPIIDKMGPQYAAFILQQTEDGRLIKKQSQYYTQFQ